MEQNSINKFSCPAVRRSIALLFALILFSASVYPAAARAETVSNFQIRQLRAENGQRQIVRFNSKTGEAWYNWTTSGLEWTKVNENGPVPPGDFDVLLLGGLQNDSAWGLRFEKNSGKTWNFGPKGWEEYKEPTLVPAAPPK